LTFPSQTRILSAILLACNKAKKRRRSEVMNTSTQHLELQAIQAAKSQDWELAVNLNQQISEMDMTDIGALNRLGVAHVQLGQIKQAKAAFEKVLEIDKTNGLAKKHLLKLKNNQPITLHILPKDEEFIEEPGKTKTVELNRLAGKEQLDKYSVGQSCQLKPKGRFISVEIDKTYIGSLPEDLSARLTKLIKDGNEYACYIQSISSTSCSVFLKEMQRSKNNEFVHSFPIVKSQLSSLNDIFLTDESVPLQMEDIPLQIVETDSDEEGSHPRDFSMEEPLEEVNEEPESSTDD
jgi:tetratricopeptide (TPR) repeat protein